jgi:hypothetical protein
MIEDGSSPIYALCDSPSGINRLPIALPDSWTLIPPLSDLRHWLNATQFVA